MHTPSADIYVRQTDLSQYCPTHSQEPSVVDALGGRAETPGATPSESEASSAAGTFKWKPLLLWISVFALLAAFISVLVVFHNGWTTVLTPAIKWMYNLPAGWLVCIAIMVILSIPPLHGRDAIPIWCGLVWGPGIGFAIAAAGTFLGHVCAFYLLKYCRCIRRICEKQSISDLHRDSLMNLVRDEGFKMALVARLSFECGQEITLAFSTCGMGIITFCATAILSLTKQVLPVYLGALYMRPTYGTATSSHIVMWSVIGITTLTTISTQVYIVYAVKQQFVRDRQARQAILSSPPLINISQELPSLVPLFVRHQPDHQNPPAVIGLPTYNLPSNPLRLFSTYYSTELRSVYIAPSLQSSMEPFRQLHSRHPSSELLRSSYLTSVGSNGDDSRVYSPPPPSYHST